MDRREVQASLNQATAIGNLRSSQTGIGICQELVMIEVEKREGERDGESWAAMPLARMTS